MKNKLILGVIITLISGLIYATQAAVAKVAVGHTPLSLLLLGQNVIGLILTLPVLIAQPNMNIKQQLLTNHPWIHLIRTVFTLGIGFFLYAALKHIPLVDGVLMANTSPLMVPFLMLLLFKQKINHKLWLGLVLGFLGVILVLHPDGKVFNWYSILALGSGLSIAIVMILVRRTTAKDHVNTISFYYLFYGSIIMFFISIPDLHLLTIKMLLPLAMVGVLSYLTQYTMTLALRFSTAELVSTLFYSNLIYASIISMVFFNAGLSWLTIGGTILIVAGGIWVILQQAKAKSS